MKVLVIGGGGREHALCWKIRQSPLVSRVYCAPGNAGISRHAECVNIKVSDIDGLVRFTRAEEINLTIVGPELPLAFGITDRFLEEKLRIFGPTKAAAEIESSKVFAKNLMRKYKIPTAFYSTFYNFEDAVRWVKEVKPPLVVKADGLAAGKGVVICRTEKEAVETLDAMMRSKIFGEAGDRVVIEEFMEGEEASFLAFTDGDTVLPMESCQDHKALLDGDQGPNTGGMGAYSPAPVVTAEVRQKIMERIMIPAVNALKEEGRKYKGILYAGLMIKDGEPSVLEFNCRFGDPEAQPLMVRMKSDIVPLINAVIDERLSGQVIDWKDESSVCVVMASRGYPGDYKKGIEIKGIKNVEVIDGVFVFHSGTAFENGKIVIDGGRVLGVTALGSTISEAINLAYKAVEKIDCEVLYYRTDIGKKALKHL
ncbi:MAG TPA: phosphoribosylamine--glycine ligase [Thermodesulfobacteriota bacterium]|jgi:phosphoribosylamine--glycine ligase|nr:phosphoribosylamine--glycine ligase [Thermodesulfobacteriota bacterium]